MLPSWLSPAKRLIRNQQNEGSNPSDGSHREDMMEEDEKLIDADKWKSERLCPKCEYSEYRRY